MKGVSSCCRLCYSSYKQQFHQQPLIRQKTPTACQVTEEPQKKTLLCPENVRKAPTLESPSTDVLTEKSTEVSERVH